MTYPAMTRGFGLKIGLTAAMMSILLTTAALAVSITNQDNKEHTVTVDRGATESTRKVSAGDTLKVDCPERCGLRVVGSGYGRQPGPDGKLIIDQAGMLRFADETASSESR